MTEQDKDIKAIMEAIEELVLNSPKVPIANKLMVDEEKLFDLLDNLRQKLPAEISEAKHLVQNKTQLIAKATKQAQDIVSQAEKTSKDKMTKIKNLEDMLAKKLVPPEAARALEIQKRSADKYTDDTLANLEKSLNQRLEEVRNGKKAINNMTTAKN